MLLLLKNSIKYLLIIGNKALIAKLGFCSIKFEQRHDVACFYIEIILVLFHRFHKLKTLQSVIKHYLCYYSYLDFVSYLKCCHIMILLKFYLYKYLYLNNCYGTNFPVQYTALLRLFEIFGQSH